MEIIFLLIPLSLILVGVALWAFFWATKSGQFDDLDAPALMILDDDTDDVVAENFQEANEAKQSINS